MTIWKNTCGESWQHTIENGWEVSGKPGAFLFFYPEGRTYSPPAKAGGGSPPVGRARALSEGDCGSCGSRWTRLHFCQTASLAHAVGAGLSVLEAPVHGVVYCPPSRRLPASTCHRQLDTDTGGERIVPPLLVVRRISRRTERKQGCPVSGHPFQKGQGDLWQFIIWRPRWSVVESGALPWLLRPI